MMKFALIASGSKGNSFLLQDDQTAVLIDCGSTKKHLFTSLEKLSVSLADLDGLVITHDHSDHVSQIRFFADVDIYSPVDIPDMDVFSVRAGQPFVIGSLRFMPLALSHDALHTTGYVIDNGTQKLVYITDTGYLNRKYFPLLAGADYIILEANHDPEMLMRTRRPQYLKQRIYSDTGHLNNEDCAAILNAVVNENTKVIILAHISQQANTREKALETVRRVLMEEHTGRLNDKLILAAAGQFEMIVKGESDEEMDPGTVSCSAGMEYMLNHQSR